MKNNRKNYLVNPRFQVSFILYTVGASLILAGIIFAADQYFFAQMFEKGRTIGLDENHPYFSILSEQHSYKMMISLAAAGISVFFLTLTGILMSHKIAGPLHKLSKFLEIHNGNTDDIPDLEFREGDYFKEIADQTNDFVHRMGS